MFSVVGFHGATPSNPIELGTIGNTLLFFWTFANFFELSHEISRVMVVIDGEQ